MSPEERTAMQSWAADVPVPHESYRRVLRALCDFHQMRQEEAIPSHVTLAERLQLSESTVRRGIYWLRDRGLIVVERRKRHNGSQTSNRYWLCFQNHPELDGHEGRLYVANHPELDGHEDPLVEAVNTPLGNTTTTTTANSDQPPLGVRARCARPKIKDMRQLEPESWAGAVEGELEVQPSASTARPKARVQSGNVEVDRTAPLIPAVTVPTRAAIDHAVSKLRAATARASKPVSDWNNGDLARAWREMFWDTCQKHDCGSLRALEVKFAEMKRDGVTNADIVAISKAFFADPRRWQGVPGQVVHRRFMAQRGNLLLQVKPPVINGGYFSTSLPDTSASDAFVLHLPPSVQRKAAS